MIRSSLTEGLKPKGFLMLKTYNKYLYLFTLEVSPLDVGRAYESLPSHLTMMSRFLSVLPPNEIADIVRPLFAITSPVQLTFGGLVRLGPKKLTVHLVENTDALKSLHSRLYDLLGTINVTYAYPQYVGDGYRPHVTRRDGDQFVAGHKQKASSAYLIEVETKGEEHVRYVRAKFDLNS